VTSDADHPDRPRHLAGTTLLLETSVPFESRLGAIDMNALRSACSALMDKAAHEVFQLGLDFDDVIVERQLACAGETDTPTRVPLPSLTDPAAIEALIPTHLTVDGRVTSVVAQVFGPAPA